MARLYSIDRRENRPHKTAILRDRHRLLIICLCHAWTDNGVDGPTTVRRRTGSSSLSRLQATQSIWTRDLTVYPWFGRKKEGGRVDVMK